MDEPFRPDPERGVFATMLVVDGRPLELAAHVARLRASVRALYGEELPDDAAAVASAGARELALGRLRLSVVPGEHGGRRLETVAQPIDRTVVLPGWAYALDLRTTVVEGWNGAHKWADRRLLEQLDAQVAPATALLVDPVNGVLETTRANVFAVGEDDVLWTPPADGSILPGITRARTLEVARELGLAVREEPLSVERVIAAAEVFVTGSVRGVEPVRTLDGIELGGPGEFTIGLGSALKRRWFRAGAPARSRS